MNTPTDRIELLAPAKDAQGGIAAIDCGADAVYIGGTDFGARENAANSLEAIRTLIDYAHKYWAKVYVTVNTLLHDDEIPSAMQMIEELYAMGADALIVQDTGLLECDLPDIPLIASTQMHNNSPERVAFWGKVGFKRAILARELTLPEIQAIRRSTPIELECFIHGALCVGYSGQCYMSYSLGGRSGNRGRCAQPCRKLYDLVESSGKILAGKRHFLSLKDLNMSEHLETLIDAGVCSFKIEGRLKDRTYVMNVVTHYRALLDEILARRGLTKSSSGVTTPSFTPDVNKTFNRGYTDGFFIGKESGKMGSILTPKMAGEHIGKVVSVKGRTAKLDAPHDLHPGDGVCFFSRSGELKGSVVNAVNGPLVTLDKLHGLSENMQLFRNRDHVFLTKLAGAQPSRKIPIRISFSKSQDGLTANAVDADGVNASAHIPCTPEPAQKPEQAMENIRRQMAKTGDSHFICTEVDINLTEPIFVPISTLNALRRSLTDALTSARQSARPVDTGGARINIQPFPEDKLSFEGNVLNQKAREFYTRYGVKEIEPAAESGTDLLGKRVMRSRYCIKHQMDMCPKYGGKAYNGQLYLVDMEGNRFRLEFDCASCEMNIYLEKRAN